MSKILLQEEAGTPSTPGSGKWAVYFKSDGIYIIDDTGAEHGPLEVSGPLTLPEIYDASSDHKYIFAVSELTANRTITLPLLTSNDVFIFQTLPQSISQKRIIPRVGTTTSSATPTINTDNYDFYHLTAQAVDITSFTTNLSGTNTDGQKLWIAITGTAARAITWGASFETGAVALPTTTVTTQRLDVGFVWNSVTSKWRCMASGSG